MNVKKTILGLSLVCALLFGAFAASSASAAGTTAFTCAESPANTTLATQFKDEHCQKATTTEAEKKAKGFKHVEIKETTAITGTNAKTASETTAAASSILRTKASGLETEIVCTTVSGTGELTNSLNGAEKVASGTGTITYTGCTAPKPTGQECKVKGGQVVTKKLAATTKEQGKLVKFSPFEGTTFATITFEGCKTAGLNIEYPLTGSLKATPEGATLSTTEAGVTTQGLLKFGGQAAGLEGKLTLKNTASGTALTVTE